MTAIAIVVLITRMRVISVMLRGGIALSMVTARHIGTHIAKPSGVVTKKVIAITEATIDFPGRSK